ncbi:hypothetical protein CRUP_033006 [Coryphaenoides rupestris]|nr:hypothetical protein CRUP_033006 [Coryphaenoides rupestris]
MESEVREEEEEWNRAQIVTGDVAVTQGRPGRLGQAGLKRLVQRLGRSLDSSGHWMDGRNLLLMFGPGGGGGGGGGRVSNDRIVACYVGIMSVDTKSRRRPCCSKLKLFLVSLSLAYFTKAFGGAYMKSSVTQIERRFDIPSSLIGYETSMSHNLDVNTTETMLPCLTNQSTIVESDEESEESRAVCEKEAGSSMWVYVFLGNMLRGIGETPITPLGVSYLDDFSREENTAFYIVCEKEAGSSMWVYVFLGNMLRGIGETPITPLGVSYLDDFSREENTAFYIACIQTVGILGPMLGFMLGSYCAKIYVDIGSVDLDSVSINDKDSRWVGAWWLGFLVTGALMLLSSVPFFFLPKSIPKQGREEEEEEEEEDDQKPAGSSGSNAEHDNFLPGEKSPSSLAAAEKKQAEKDVNFTELAKDFLPSLRRLFSNRVFPLIILTSLVAVNGFIGMITFKPKYMEQIYGQSASKAIFLIVVKKTKQNVRPHQVFHNCTCVSEVLLPAANMSAVLGQCPRRADCNFMFKLYMAVSVLGAFVSACGGTPGYIVLLRSIQPDLKSLALGMQTLIVRTLDQREVRQTDRHGHRQTRGR